MKTQVTVSVEGYNEKTGILTYRIASKEFTGELWLDSGSKIKIDANTLTKIENRAMAFFDALNEAFYEFAESNSNHDKLKFDFYF